MNRLAPLGLASMLLVMIFQSAIFKRSKWQGIDRELEFGCWLGLAAFVRVAGGMTSIVAWPLKVTVGMALPQVVQQCRDGILPWMAVSQSRFRIERQVTGNDRHRSSHVPATMEWCGRRRNATKWR